MLITWKPEWLLPNASAHGVVRRSRMKPDRHLHHLLMMYRTMPHCLPAWMILISTLFSWHQPTTVARTISLMNILAIMPQRPNLRRSYRDHALRIYSMIHRGLHMNTKRMRIATMPLHTCEQYILSFCFFSSSIEYIFYSSFCVLIHWNFE